MNTQKQSTNDIQLDVKWQAPELVELGNISVETQLGNRLGADFSASS